VALVGHQNNNVHKRGPQCTNDQVHFVAFATTAFYEPEVQSHTYHTPTHPADAYSKFSCTSKSVMSLTPFLTSIVDVYERPNTKSERERENGLSLASEGAGHTSCRAGRPSPHQECDALAKTLVRSMQPPCMV